MAGCYVFLISAIHLSAASVLLLGNTTRCPCYCNCQRVLKQIISRKSDKHIPSPTRVCKNSSAKPLLGQHNQPQEMGMGKEQGAAAYEERDLLEEASGGCSSAMC